MGFRKSVKFALALLQVGILASAFFFFFGWIAMILYVLGEISIAEILDYLLVMASMEGFSFVVFLERSLMGCLEEEQKIGEEKMIDTIMNFLLGLIDDTWNNDEDADEKLKVIEREKIKQLRRK